MALRLWRVISLVGNLVFLVTNRVRDYVIVVIPSLINRIDSARKMLRSNHGDSIVIWAKKHDQLTNVRVWVMGFILFLFTCTGNTYCYSSVEAIQRLGEGLPDWICDLCGDGGVASTRFF